MMRILQIAFLWFAGFLLVGHSIIPHHHHESEQEYCAENQHDHEHNHNHTSKSEPSNKLYSFNDCCNDQETSHEACLINQRTIVKDNSAPFTLFANTTFGLPELKETKCKLWNNLSIGTISNALWDNSPSRAPPLA